MGKGIWIGLCGNSGAGKGYVCRKFLAHGIPSVDTDAVYRSLTGPGESLSPCMAELVAFFGEEIVHADYSLNRQVLSKIVFSDESGDALAALNRITHKYILQETKRLGQSLIDDGAPAVIVDAPVLFESGFDAFCDCTVCVTAPHDVLVSRIMTRDGASKEQAERRLAHQIPGETLQRRCDYHIANGLFEPTLEESVKAVAGDILRRFGEGGEKL